MKAKPLTKLTESEKDFAAAHIGLIKYYLVTHHLDTDIYYDIAVFGYLRAVKVYTQRQDLQKFMFSTICYRYIQAEISHYFARIQTQKRTIDRIAYSLDQTISNESSNALYDIVSDNTDFTEEIIESMTLNWMIDRISKQLSPLDRRYLQAIIKANGFLPDIAKEMSVSMQAAHQHLKRIREATTYALEI